MVVVVVVREQETLLLDAIERQVYILLGKRYCHSYVEAVRVRRIAVIAEPAPANNRPRVTLSSLEVDALGCKSQT